MTRRSSGLSLQDIAGAPLRALTRFGGSQLAARFHLHEPAEKVIFEATRSAARAIAASAAFVRSAKSADPKRLAPSTGSGLFDLTPTEDQALMRDAMRRFADEALRPAARAADDAAAPSDEILQQGHALGLAGLSIPEELGGVATERSSVTNALIAEELARGDMGLAAAILSPLAAVQAIVEWGTGAQQARFLPPFLGDRFVPAALAVLEPRPLFDPMRLRAGAVRADGGWKLYGEKALVPLATQAALFVVAAEVRGLGARLFVVEQGTPGLHVESEPAMGLRGAGLGRLRFEGALVPEDALLGEVSGDGAAQMGALVDRARIAWGAMAVGTSQAVLDYVIPYCNERKAFGEPISNRQGVAFPIADIAIELEGMRLLVLRAASRVDRGSPAGRAASLARLQCASKGVKIGSDGVQLLGGHGFIKEHPVERWYRDLRAIGVLEGALLA
ncbi:MAG TPA: acyl-CoA dehydrogenase family protein [Polyangiaceae bacterium]|nr:acyl-CoA dehydrogenase family protein [Polyangiaceae bacterium]